MGSSLASSASGSAVSLSGPAPSSAAASGSPVSAKDPELSIKRRLKVWEDLYTNWGQENMKAWFLARSNKSKTSNTCYMAENSFVNFLRQLTDLSDWEILEVFDILGPSRSLHCYSIMPD